MAVLDYDPCAMEDSAAPSPNQQEKCFTAEQEARLATRYDDLHDDEYASWLEINHPEVVVNLRLELNSLTCDEELFRVQHL